jgi:hypothetical protein
MFFEPPFQGSGRRVACRWRLSFFRLRDRLHPASPAGFDVASAASELSRIAAAALVDRASVQYAWKCGAAIGSALARPLLQVVEPAAPGVCLQDRNVADERNLFENVSCPIIEETDALLRILALTIALQYLIGRTKSNRINGLTSAFPLRLVSTMPRSRVCKQCHKLSHEYDRRRQIYEAARARLSATWEKAGGTVLDAADETGYQRLRLARDDAWIDLELARLALEEHQREHV